MLTQDEKKFLKLLVKHKLAHYKKDRELLSIDLPVGFEKVEQNYKHFLENLLKKLGAKK